MPLEMDSCQQYIQAQAFISASWWQYTFHGEIGPIALGSYLCLEMSRLCTWGGSHFHRRRTVRRVQAHQVQEM